MAPAAGADPGEAVLGSVDGVPIRRRDLPADVQASLDDLRNEQLQRQLHMTWAGFEEAIDARLLAAEAAREGISVEELRRREIDARVAEPTEEEVRAFYDEHQDRIGVPFEDAKLPITRTLAKQRRQGVERSLVARLRENVQIEYALPVPDLPRFPVSDGGAPSKGPEGAPVTVVEFSDFQCPYCSEARELLDRLRELYPDQVRVVYRDFPLAQHEQARPAAEAAQCAHEQGQFWAYHDLLFDNQTALRDDDLRRYAQEVGLDLGTFETCMASDRPRQKVRGHEEDGERAGVRGTPAIFINGVKLIGLLPLPVVRALIDRELRGL